MDHPDIARALLTGYPRARYMPDDDTAYWLEELRCSIGSYIESAMDAGEEPSPYEFMAEFFPGADEHVVELEFDKTMEVYRNERIGPDGGHRRTRAGAAKVQDHRSAIA